MGPAPTVIPSRLSALEAKDYGIDLSGLGDNWAEWAIEGLDTDAPIFVAPDQTRITSDEEFRLYQMRDWTPQQLASQGYGRLPSGELVYDPESQYAASIYRSSPEYAIQQAQQQALTLLKQDTNKLAEELAKGGKWEFSTLMNLSESDLRSLYAQETGITELFPEKDIDEALGRLFPANKTLAMYEPVEAVLKIREWAESSPEAVLDFFKQKGDTPDTRLILQHVFPGITEQDIAGITAMEDTPSGWERMWRKLGESLHLGMKYNLQYSGIPEKQAERTANALVRGGGNFFSILGFGADWLKGSTPPVAAGGFFDQVAGMVAGTMYDALSLVSTPAKEAGAGIAYATRPSEGVFFKALESLPTTMAAMAPGIALVATGVGAPAGVTWAGTVLTMMLGAAASRPLEGFMEAGGTYQEALGRGMSEAEASQAATEVFKRNMLFMGADAAQYAIAFGQTLMPKPLRAVTSLVGKGLVTTGKVGVVALTEAGEEYYQELIQRAALGEDVEWSPTAIWGNLSDDELRDVVIIGAMMGGVLGGTGDVITTLKSAMPQNLPKTEQQVYYETKAEAVREGISLQKAEMMALDAAMQTEGGRATVQKVLKALRVEEFRRMMRAKSEAQGRALDERLDAQRPDVRGIDRLKVKIGSLVREFNADQRGAIGEGEARFWEMTQEEFVASEQKKGVNIEELKAAHRQIVYQALADGEFVSQNVTKDYPGIEDQVEYDTNTATLAPSQQQPPAVTPEQAQKQPWEMTQEEYRRTWVSDEFMAQRSELEERAQEESSIEERQGFEYSSGVKRQILGAPNLGRMGLDRLDARMRLAPKRHERLVRQALAEGKPVPAEVLAEYPELQQPEVAQPPAQPVAEAAPEPVEAQPAPEAQAEPESMEPYPVAMPAGARGGIPMPPSETITPEIAQPSEEEGQAGSERDRIIAQTEEQIRQDAPGRLTKLMHRVPGLRRAVEFERPSLKMTGENQKVLTAMVAEHQARADVSTRAMSTRIPILKELSRVFGKDALRGGKVDVRFMGTPEQAASPITGTLKDICDNPELYALTPDQKKALQKMESRNDALLDQVVGGYAAEIGRYQAKEGGAFLPNIDVSEDVVEYLDSETRAVAQGRGKTRVWRTARDRMAHDKTFKPETDVQKLIEGLDSFKAGAAGGTTYRQAIGGMTRLEAMETTHPDLYKRMTGLRNRLQKLQGYENALEEKQQEAIDAFMESPVEAVDISQLQDALDVKLEPGRYVSKAQAGKSIEDIQAEIDQVKAELRELKPYWDAANLKPYVLVQEGIYRYFPMDTAKLIVESRKTTKNPILRFAENWRGGAFSGDLSPFAIQGSIGVLADPYGAIKAFTGMIKGSIAHHDVMRAMKAEALAEDVAANPDEWAQYASLLGRQLQGTPHEYAAGFLSKIPGFSKFTESTYITVTRQSFAMWQRLTKNLMRSGTPEIEAKVAAIDMVSEVYPLINPTRLGQSQARASLMRALPTSYSFIRQPMSMMAEAARGTGKIVTRQKLTPQESMSVKIMATMSASVMTAAVTSAIVSGLAGGKDDDEIWQDVKDVLNPDPYNGKFACLIIGDKRIPLGGPYRAIFRAVFPQDVEGVPFPVPFAGIPRFIANRINPAMKTQIDLLLNRDYSGFAIMTGGVPEKIIRGLLYELENVLPLSVGSLAEGIRQERDGNQIMQEVISQFMGVNVVTLDNTYFDRIIRRLGEPTGETPREFSTEPDLYKSNNLWGDTLRILRDMSLEEAKKRRYPEQVMAILEANGIKNEVDLLPNSKLYNINADPGKGDTFLEYYDQWQERLRLGDDAGKIKEFDKLYPRAHLGNLTQRQYHLLRQYHQIDDPKEQEAFLEEHPEIAEDPRESFLRANPEANAKLALWGQAKVYTKAAYDKLLTMAKDLGIPDAAMVNVIPENVADAYFEYDDLVHVQNLGGSSPEALLLRMENPAFDAWGQKNSDWQPVSDKKLSIDALRISVEYREQDDTYDGLGTSNERLAYLIENPEYTKARYRREAYNKGYPAESIDDYVAYREWTSLNGYDGRMWLSSHRDFYNVARPIEGWAYMDFRTGARSSIGGISSTFIGARK
ncbi:MAG: hypothetical protein M0R06_07330 [Sphaerochaeta sp.]|nr:hypothetical protein [Sphaerochaeta sp.]